MNCASTNTIAALLAGAADPDAAARLEVHLDQCGACRRLVAELGRGLSVIEHAVTPASQLPRLGEKIGRYTIRRVVGVGGMGVVYEAHDATLDRKVALKLLRPDLLEGPSLIAEAQAMARLQHPNIVTVHDAGIASGQLYVCMEYVAGSTLRAWVAQRSHDWRAITTQYLAAGEGLAYVHRARLVHLDFKPDNVLVDRDGRTRVTDFGLARMIGVREKSHIVGTPAYMAPEQRRSGTVDARADQYAFCASLREGLQHTSPPGRLRRAIERGLAERPGDRFANMAELLAAIARGLERPRRSIVALGVVAVAIMLAMMLPRPTRTVTTMVDRPQTVWRDRERIVASEVPTHSNAPVDVAAPRALESSQPTTRVQAARSFEARRTPALRVEPVGWSMLVGASTDRDETHDSVTLDDDSSTLFPPTCNDGTQLRCAQEPPACAGRHVAAVRNGCWSCEDPFTCWSHTPQAIAPSPMKRKPKPTRKPSPHGVGSGGSGSNSGSGAGSGSGWTSETAPVCGNLFCEAGEEFASCASDCCETDSSGSCLAMCGNGFCEAGENHASCAGDCCETTSTGACMPVCGNGFCEEGESAASCPTECP